MMMTTFENDALTLFPVSTLAMVEEVVWLPVIAPVTIRPLLVWLQWLGPLETERIEVTAIEPSDVHGKIVNCVCRLLVPRASCVWILAFS